MGATPAVGAVPTSPTLESKKDDAERSSALDPSLQPSNMDVLPAPASDTRADTSSSAASATEATATVTRSVTNHSPSRGDGPTGSESMDPRDLRNRSGTSGSIEPGAPSKAPGAMEPGTSSGMPASVEPDSLARVNAAHAEQFTALVDRMTGTDRTLAPTAWQTLLQAADGSAGASTNVPAPIHHLGTLPDGQPQAAVPMRPGLSVSVPIQSPQWGDEVGQHVRWMVGNQVQAAELRINPPELGSIDVRITVQHDQTSVVFLSQHAHVRDALMDSLPRLRDMMAEGGLGSVSVDVSHHPSQGQRNADPRAEGTHDPSAGDGSIPVDPFVSSAWTGSSLLDLYA
jgi:flagellar hook-length control protein FliK